MKAEASSLWRDREFVRLWVGQTASQFGAQASGVTLPLIAVIALGAGAGQLGLLRAAQQLPVLLLSLFVGVLVDRWRSRNMMVFADFGRAVVLAVIPVAYALHMLGISVLFIVAFLVGVFTVCFDVAYQSSLVSMVDRAQLAQGNSMLESSTSAGQLGGPALGGGLVTLLSAPIAIVASVAFFTLSFLSISRIRRTDSSPRRAELPVGMLQQIRDGLRLVARDATLRAIGLASGSYQLFFAAFMTIYLLFLPRALDLSGAEVGLALAALGPGSLVGSILPAKLPRYCGYGVLITAAAVTSDVVLLCVPGLHGSGALTVVALTVINFLFGVSSQTVNVTILAVRQAVTPQEMQGRVVATIHFVGMGLAPLGSLLGGYLASELGLRTSLLLVVMGLWLSPLCIALSPLARLGKQLPTGDLGATRTGRCTLSRRDRS